MKTGLSKVRMASLYFIDLRLRLGLGLPGYAVVVVAGKMFWLLDAFLEGEVAEVSIFLSLLR